jgi:hypothetical protein
MGREGGGGLERRSGGVYPAGDAINQSLDIEVDYEPERVSPCPEVAEELRGMNVRDPFDRFELDHDLFFNYKIKSLPDKRETFVVESHRNLATDFDVVEPQLMGERLLV